MVSKSVGKFGRANCPKSHKKSEMNVRQGLGALTIGFYMRRSPQTQWKGSQTPKPLFLNQVCRFWGGPGVQGQVPSLLSPAGGYMVIIGVRGYPEWGYFTPGCGRGKDLDRTPVVMSRRRRRRRRPPNFGTTFGQQLFFTNQV